MIILGIILLVIGFFTGIYFLLVVGAILFAVGLILLCFGASGHAVGSRNHYY